MTITRAPVFLLLRLWLRPDAIARSARPRAQYA